VKKIKKIILLILIPFLFVKITNAEISDSIFMSIGDKPITKSDIVNEIKIILILNNESYTDDKKEQLHEVAVKSVVKRNIKLIEIERYNFKSYNEEDFQKELLRLASNLYIDVETLKNICASNDLDFSIIEDQIKVELHWNTLIFELYKDSLQINPEQIEERLKLFQENKKIQEYLISEIVIDKVPESEIELKMDEIKNKIEIDGFESVAKNLSISESSIRGGDLGWVNEDIISEKIKSKLANTPVNEISSPIILSEGILIFKVRDKREVSANLSLEEMKNKLVASEKTRILNMHSLSHYDKVRRSVSINFFNE